MDSSEKHGHTTGVSEMPPSQMYYSGQQGAPGPMINHPMSPPPPFQQHNESPHLASISPQPYDMQMQPQQPGYGYQQQQPPMAYVQQPYPTHQAPQGFQPQPQQPGAQPFQGQGQNPQQYHRAQPIPSLGMAAAPVDCPNCRQRCMTNISYHAGNTTHVWALATFCFTGCLCFIPYLMNSIKDVQHRCGNCGVLLATWHKSGQVEVHMHA